MFSRGLRRFSGDSQEVLRGSEEVLRRFSKGFQTVLNRISKGQLEFLGSFSKGSQEIFNLFSKGSFQGNLRRFIDGYLEVLNRSLEV